MHTKFFKMAGFSFWILFLNMLCGMYLTFSIPRPGFLRWGFAFFGDRTGQMTFILVLGVLFQIPTGSFILKVLLMYLPALLLFVTDRGLQMLWRKKFCFQIEFFIHHLIFHIKTGLSFRSAFQMAVRGLSSQVFQKDFLEILDFIVFSRDLSPRFVPFRQIISELGRADKAPGGLLYLENLRLHIKTRSLFRRKANSALLHVRVQAVVLFLIYSGLFVLVLYQYGLKYQKMVFLSVGLFAAGLFFLLRMGRSLKWSI